MVQMPKRWGQLVTVALCLLAVACPIERGPAKKVLVIGIDGVRPDVLAQVPTPHLDSLIAAGAYGGRIATRAQTISGPGWSSILTGVWPAKHGVVNNDFSTNNYAAYPDFLTRVEKLKPKLTTIAVVSWPPLADRVSGGPLISDSVDSKLVFSGDDVGYVIADSLTVAAAARFLRNQNPDAVFVYIGNPDVVAHEKGGLSPEYRASLALADAHVGRLIDALHGRSTYAQENWLIIVCTDHGHKDEGGHGGDSPAEKTVFYLVSGPHVTRGSLPPSVNLVDVAATALTHLGIPLDPAWRLDGQAAGLRPPETGGR
jgi:predicted AlkP superfamily pyrophosphatase or phosphodiesterase